MMMVGYSAGGSFIDAMVKKLMTNEPTKILDINKDKFMKLINTC